MSEGKNEPSAEQIVASKAQLAEIKLQHCTFDLHAAKPEGNLVPRFDRDVTAHVVRNGVSITFLKWDVEIKVQAAEGEELKDFLSCSTEWGVVYRGVEGCDPEAICNFSQRVGIMNSYPYARGIVSQMCWSAGVMIPPMPLITPGYFPLIPFADLVAEEDVEAEAEENVEAEEA